MLQHFPPNRHFSECHQERVCSHFPQASAPRGTNFTGKVLQPDNMLPFLDKQKSSVFKLIRNSLVCLRQLAVLLLCAADLNLLFLKGNVLIPRLWFNNALRQFPHPSSTKRSQLTGNYWFCHLTQHCRAIHSKSCYPLCLQHMKVQATTEGSSYSMMCLLNCLQLGL